MTMSGGEQQMLAIARALMSRPKLLLLDEPSLGLAPIVVKQIFQTLRELARNGMTIFLVEQNAHHALKLSDRGYVMVNGQIRLSGSGEELLGSGGEEGVSGWGLSVNCRHKKPPSVVSRHCLLL